MTPGPELQAASASEESAQKKSGSSLRNRIGRSERPEAYSSLAAKGDGTE